MPQGFVRIRYYGIWANRHRQELLQRCRQLIEAQGGVPLRVQLPDPRFGPPEFETDDEAETLAELLAALPEIPCPACGRRSLIVVIYARPSLPEILSLPWSFDSS